MGYVLAMVAYVERVHKGVPAQVLSCAVQWIVAKVPISGRVGVRIVFLESITPSDSTTDAYVELMSDHELASLDRVSLPHRGHGQPLC